MGSKVEHKITAIHLNEENLKPGSDSWDSACEQVRYGMEEYGCFEIIFDMFPTELHSSIFGAAKDLFDLPVETKMQITSRVTAEGYVDKIPSSPRYESIAVENANTLQGAEYFTKLMWPAGNDVFSETLNSFSKRTVELYEIATRMVFDSYGVERLFDSITGSTYHLLRFIKYRTMPLNKEDDIGLVSHVDTSFITILHQHQAEGLQIKTKDDQWIDVKPAPSSFVVLAGDLLLAWSNDKVRPCVHQVVIKEDKTRYSIALFTFPKGVICVPEEMVDEKHPLRYKPIDSLDFLGFRFSKEGKKSACPIKAYCGINCD